MYNTWNHNKYLYIKNFISKEDLKIILKDIKIYFTNNLHKEKDGSVIKSGQQTQPNLHIISKSKPWKNYYKKLNELANILGKEKLTKRKENPQRKLVGLELTGKEKSNHGDCVHIGRSQVGVITSGCISPTLNKNIALCRIDVGHSEIGNEVEVGKMDGHQKRIPAKIVPFPFYDPQKTKVRA